MKRLATNIALTIALILLLIFAAVYDLKAQTLEAGVLTQKTVMGLQTGHEVGFRMANGLGATVFHQSGKHMSFEKSHQNYPFTGVDFSARVKSCDNIKVMAHLKSGIVNKQFVVVTPELETRISLTPFIHLAFGAGIRSRQAAISGKIILSTF